MRKPLLLILVFAVLLLSITAYFWGKSKFSKAAQGKPTSALAKQVAPPPMELLGQGIRPPTQEELADETRYNDKQVAIASEWVNSTEAEKRRIGVEQLSAFPTPESEQVLVTTLALDTDPEVRRTAAQSLAAFKQPTENAVTGLLGALEDQDEKVQMSALNTLLAFANRFEYNSPKMKNLLASLSHYATSRRTEALTKQAIRSFLKDQAPPLTSPRKK